VRELTVVSGGLLNSRKRTRSKPQQTAKNFSTRANARSKIDRLIEPKEDKDEEVPVLRGRDTG
jgi:hypothetical protein